MNFIKEPHTAIFSGVMGCGKDTTRSRSPRDILFKPL